MKKYDAIIIGFGKGGKTLAADLANHGWNVAVVERSTEALVSISAVYRRKRLYITLK